jgi:hypothetical protein
MIYELYRSHYNYGDYLIAEFPTFEAAREAQALYYNYGTTGIWDYLIYEREDESEGS